MKLSERMKLVSKKQKMTIATVAIFMLLGGAFGYKAYADAQTKKQVEQAQILVNTQSNDMKELQTEIKELFNDKKTDFLNKDVSEKTIASIQEKLDTIEKKYDAIVLPTKDVKTEKYSNYLTSTKESLKIVQLMLDTQKQVNGLFGKVVIAGDTVAKDVAIKDDLKADIVKTVKDSSYNKESKSEWQKAINSLLDSADEQLKQIEKAKQTVEKVFKDNKIVNTEQKNYDSAKSETEKIKNQKAKNELFDKLAKVKQEIDAKVKAETEKKSQEQAVEVIKTQGESSSIKNESDAINQGTGSNNESVANNAAETNQDYQGYPTNNGTGVPSGGNYGVNGSSSGNSGSTGGQTGGNQGGGTTTPPTTPPTEPEQPTGPPAGWIVPPYPIGSMDLVNWLADQGYSGYDSSGGYIRPY